MRELDPKKGEVDWQKKYTEVQDFNKKLIDRLRSVQEEAKQLKSGDQSMKKSIEEKEAAIKVESERVSKLQEEIAALVASQSHYDELSAQAEKL